MTGVQTCALPIFVTGIGVPQVTAIINCSKVAKKYNIPIIADGGIKYSGDITKAIGAGANVVMAGSLVSIPRIMRLHFL